MEIRITDAAGRLLGPGVKTVLGAPIGWTIEGLGGGVTEPQWQITGVQPIVADYAMDKHTARVSAGVDLTSATLNAYWAAKGQFTVRATARVGGVRRERSVMVTVTGPTLVEFTAVTDTVQVADCRSPLSGRNALYLTFGGTSATQVPGIKWTARVIAPDSRGDFGFTQLMVVNRRRSKQGGAGEHMTSDGEYVLDEVVFYEMDEGDEEKKTASCLEWEALRMVSEDSPAMGLPDPQDQSHRGRFDHDRVEADETFLTHLMFRPRGGIWIGVGRLAWGWRGVATHDGAGWTLQSGGCTADPVGSAWVGFPTWQENRDDKM